MRARRGTLTLCLLVLWGSVFADVVVTEGGNLSADLYPQDGRIVFDLLGKIWLLPATGGQAEALTDGLHPARQPRWSPDGRRILYQVRSPDAASLWLLDLDSGDTTRIGDSRFFNQDAAWHPDGERIVFSSARNDSGFDLWEIDLPTGLRWRISSHAGDETEPAWSQNGRHLAYVRKHDDVHTLVLRRHGEPETDLLVSDQPLFSPGWRPDGSLLTVFRQDGELTTLDIVILSSPPLIRTFATDEDFFASPVRWRNRQQMLYTADGQIKTRGFGDRRSRPLRFAARVAEPAARPATVVARRELNIVDPPGERLVIRGGRLFDGIWSDYRPRMDVLIENGRIAAVEPRRDWPDATLLDLGEVTVLPGYIDSWSALPAGPAAQGGAGLLAYGVTTIVSDDTRASDLSWESEQTPGPRVLAANDIEAAVDGQLPHFVTVAARAANDETLRNAVAVWQSRGVPVLAENFRTGLALGADLLPGGDTLAGSRAGDRYLDLPLAIRDDPAVMISGLADAGTPGLLELLASRQARALRQQRMPRRRFIRHPELAAGSGTFVLGSKANGLPPGLGLHAEMRALAAAGLRGHQVLAATGHGAASVLGLDNQVGRITPGAVADLVLVSGDPLRNVADALSIVAVVRNGRFFSLVSLLERATAAENVE